MQSSHKGIRSKHNHYRGINIHLNQQLQRRDWEEYHTDTISDLRAYLNEQLRDMGYYAKLEKGLQIRREGTALQRPESDMLILDRDTMRFGQGATRFPQGTGAVIASMTDIKRVADLDPTRYQDTEFFSAVTIYKLEIPKGEDQPVAWIEMLSPSNKDGGRHYRDYLERREELLGTRKFAFVEIDYLDNSSPTLFRPDYTRQKEKAVAKPFRIIVVDTRAGSVEETARLEDYPIAVYEFGVDEPIPSPVVPLFASDIVTIELDQVYQATFRRVGYGLMPDTPVDYATVPINFEHYSAHDREHIRLRMLAVIEAALNAQDAALILDDFLEAQHREVPLIVDENRITTLRAQFAASGFVSLLDKEED